MEETVAKLEAELKAPVAGGSANTNSGRHVGNKDAEVDAGAEEHVLVVTTLELDRNDVRKKKQ